jgi:hypothetical protein
MDAQRELFSTALEEMRVKGEPAFGPIVLRDYAASQGITITRAPDHISVDFLSELSPELRMANTMVFRLGGSDGDGRTRFGLAKSVQPNVGDYFLSDTEIFGKAQPVEFVPTVPRSHMYPFALLPSFQESSLVNLGLASGLLSHALCLDRPEVPSVPAVGQGAYTFRVRPHSELAVIWEHYRGQVEIDGVFGGQRDGRDCVFVVEAKAGEAARTLAKHKLLYPVLAIADRVPEGVAIVPVYLRCVRKDSALHFYVAECAVVECRGTVPSVNSITAVGGQHFVMADLGV